MTKFLLKEWASAPLLQWMIQPARKPTFFLPAAEIAPAVSPAITPSAAVSRVFLGSLFFQDDFLNHRTPPSLSLWLLVETRPSPWRVKGNVSPSSPVFGMTCLDSEDLLR